MAVSDFAAILQSSPMSGMPQLANPAALTGELFNHLRGFVERAHYYENLKLTPPGPVHDGNLTPATAQGVRVAELPGAASPGNSALAALVPAGEGGPSASQPVPGSTLAEPQNSLSDESQKVLADLQRFYDLIWKAEDFSVETTLVGDALSMSVRSVNSLIKAQ
jgi:hypothetical protein